MKRLLLIPLIAFMISGCKQTFEYGRSYESAPMSAITQQSESTTSQVPEFTIPLEEFKFSLGFGVSADFAYDSESQKLVRTRIRYGVRNPEDYITTYSFPYVEELYNMVKEMNPYSYPEDFKPHISSNPPMSNPYLTYKLVINNKEINVEKYAIGTSKESLTEQGKKFIEVVNFIADTVMSSDEWKALPEPAWDFM